MFFKIGIVCTFRMFTEGKYWYPGVCPGFFLLPLRAVSKNAFSQHLISQKPKRFHIPLLSHPKWWRAVWKPTLSYLHGSGTDADPVLTNQLLFWERKVWLWTLLLGRSLKSYDRVPAESIADEAMTRRLHLPLTLLRTISLLKVECVTVLDS